METIIILTQAILIFMAITLLYYTITQFIMPSSNKKGRTYILQNAHNVSVNHSEDNPYLTMAGESTDGWGTSHTDIEINNETTTSKIKNYLTKLFKPSKTRVNTFGPQSRPHGYGWTPSS